ncbi:MAG: GntR family transcriptional regulator [Peptococcaceae bacterium]|nr:GntR family transcriptional regulator [Peptococcaceae bacterium]
MDGDRPLRDKVIEILRDAIVTQVLKPGERLMQVQLADEMGVSRTPLREAIRALELEGLVIVTPHKGAYVADVSMKDINEIYEVRSALEMLAVSLAVERITDKELDALERQLSGQFKIQESRGCDWNNTAYIDSTFHSIIYQAANNQCLVRFANILQEQLQQLRATSSTFPDRDKTALEEHKQIVKALVEHNGELASRLAREHVANAERAMISSMEEKTGPYN